MIPVKRAAITVGMGPDGRSMQISYVANEFRRIMVLPGQLMVIVSKHHETGEETVVEHSLKNFIGWEYSPIKTEKANAENSDVG